MVSAILEGKPDKNLILVTGRTHPKLASDVAEQLGIVPSSLTFHLQHLQRAGLITQRRQARQIIYAADYAAMRELLAFLTRNCCGRGESTAFPFCCSQPEKS